MTAYTSYTQAGTRLKGLTLEQEKTVRRAVRAIAETVYYDLQQACAEQGEELTDEVLLECVCDELYDERPMNLRGNEGWNKEVFEAWRAIDYKVRMRWLKKNFHFV